MKRTAGILKVIFTILWVLEMVAAILIAGVAILMILAGSFSDLAAKTGNAVTITSGASPAELDAAKPLVVGALFLSVVTLVFAIIGTAKTRKVLSECKEERPFSRVSVDSLKTSARMEVIGGVVGVVGAIVLSLMASGLVINGSPVAKSSTTVNLSFLIYAVMKYLLYHVAEYGHSLENKQDL